VGGSAQPKAMKKVAGRHRLDLAQFRELEAFSAFGSDLDAASKAQLERGARLVELLKQPQYQPFPMEEEVVSVWSGTTGKLDDVPLEDIKRFEREFLDYLKRDHKAVLDSIRSTTDLSDDSVRLLEGAVTTFKGQFTTSAGTPLVVNEPVAAALDESEVKHATITKVKG
jgi:F-type H+-transporting ATPase subunit alpha